MDIKNKKILIIEDSPEISRAVSRALADAGYETDSAFIGKEGVEKAKKGVFDLILLDLVMPGKSGFEVLKEIRTQRVPTPIIVYSNLPEVFTREEAVKQGAVDYFEKSTTSLAQMIERIGKFLNV